MTREKDMQHFRLSHPGIRAHDIPEWFADGCAHRDRQVVAFLHAFATACNSEQWRLAAMHFASCIERGEHVK